MLHGRHLIPCAVILVAAAAAAQAQSSQERVPRKIVELVNARIAGAIGVRTMDFSLPNKVTFGDCSLRDENGRLLAQAASITARADLGALATGDLVLSELVVERARLDATQMAGSLDVLKALAPTTRKQSADAGKPLSLQVTSFTIHRLDVTYTNGNSIADIRGVNARGDAVIHGSTVAVNASGTAQQGTVKVEDVIIPVSDVDVNGLRFAGKSIVLTHATLRVAGAPPSSATGRIRLSGDENLALSGVMHLPEGFWPAGLGDRPALIATASAQFTAEGRFADPSIRVVANAPKVSRDAWVARDVVAVAQVTRERTVIESVRFAFSGGRVNARGSYEFKPARLVMTGDLHGLALDQLVGGGRLGGALGGKVRIDGVTRSQEFRLNVGVDGSVRSLSAPGVRAQRVLTVVSDATVTPDRIEISRASLSDAGADVQARGHVDLKRQRLDLDVYGTVATTDGLLDAALKAIQLEGVEVRARVTGTTGNPRAAGVARAAGGNVEGVPVRAVLASFSATSDVVDVPTLKAIAGEGRLLGRWSASLKKQRVMTGRLQWREADAAKVQRIQDAVAMTGRLDANVIVGGTLDVPSLEVVARGQSMVVSGQPVRDLQVRGQMHGDLILIESATADVADGLVSGSGEYDLKTTAFSLDARAERIALEQVSRLSGRGIAGRGAGATVLRGTRADPQGDFNVVLTALQANGRGLGGAKLTGTLQNRRVTGHLDAPDAKLRIDGNYGLSDEHIQATVVAEGTELALIAAFVPDAPRIGGQVNARMTLAGPIKRPEGDGTIHASGVVFQGAAHEPPTALGDGAVTFRHHAGALFARAQLFGLAELAAEGPTTPGASLDIRGSVKGDILERFIPSLKSRDVRVAANGSVTGRVPVDDVKKARARIRLDALSVQADPTQPPVLNDAPVIITYDKGRLDLRQVTLASDDARVTAVGHVASGDTDVKLDGSVALSLARLVSTEVTRGDGLVDVNVHVLQRGGQPIQVLGKAVPRPGSSIAVRSLRTPIIFRKGHAEGTLEQLRFSGLHAETDTGDVEVDGVVALEDGAPQQFDVVAKAFGLTVPTSRGVVEGGFDLTLTGTAEQPRLAGSVNIQEGYLRETYEVRNFIVTRPSAAPAPPLWKRFPALANLRFDVRISAEDVRARADLEPYLVDTRVHSDFQLSGTLREPTVTGAVEIDEGKVRMANATFDIESASVEFPLRADNRIEPVLHLVARTLLPPERSPTQSELPILFTLDGPLDRMVLDLKAEEGGETYSRMELLSLVITGRSASELVMGGGAAGGDAAMRLASSQMLGGWERSLERLASEQLDLPIELQLEASYTGARATYRWQAFDRLQVEGNTDVSTGLGINSAGVYGGARARLLIIDHTPIPVVQSLSLEGNLRDVGLRDIETQTAETTLRLRFFER